jgi:Zn-dependent protease with chaperone function
MLQRFSKSALWAVVFLFLSSPHAWAMSVEDEVRIGAQAAAQFEAQYGLVQDPAYTGRLQRVAQRLMPHVQRKELPWRFSVVNVNEFNAAAFPGGFVYATRGLMDGLTDEELAFVVGHEMGHVDYRHSVKQLEGDQMRRLGIMAIVLGASGGRVSDTTATLVGLADGVISSQFSKSDESESDRYGLTLMGQAGYDPVFALSALQKLAAQSSGGTPGFLNTLIGSHPLPKDRVAAGIAQIPTVPFQAEPLPPVGSPSAPISNRPNSSALIVDGSRALEYTLSLLGHAHNPSLQRAAEALALGRGNPGAAQIVQVAGSRSAGLANLEDQLLARPELRSGKRSFGAAVVDHGGDRIEAVLLIQGGR